MSEGNFDNVLRPVDVKAVAESELPALAESLRREIVEGVSKSGGHLASSLGAVELAIGLARVFEPEKDRIVWDVGHQTYAWKLLTGRRRGFGSIRSLGGLSGFCNPEETECDAFVSGHAGSALAAAEGMAAARDLKGGSEHVVAVVGDASLTNGESLEALNNCSSLKGKIILVLNDNAMSISRNVGAFSRLLGRMLAGRRYNRVKAAAERAGHKLRLTFLRDAYHRLEQVVKSIWLGNAFFESYGLRYIGPVDGHNIRAVENALAVARDDKRSVVVHIVTVKGKGFAPAERNPTAWHGVGPFELPAPEGAGTERKDQSPTAEGAQANAATAPSPSHAGALKPWSAAFGEALVEMARKDESICALTAAMRDGTGLGDFAKEFGGRFFDSGICEEHLVTFAAGLAKSGLKPVVAVYSTFLQRAVDQIMHDVCLLNLPVVFAVDRAGCVGADGRTHHGMFDIAMLRCLPRLTVCQPRDVASLRAMLELAMAKGGPWVIRYPRGNAPLGPSRDELLPVARGRAEQVCDGDAKLQLWALGEQVEKALEVSRLLKAKGVAAGVVDVRFVKPFDEQLLAWQRAAGARIVSLENGCVAGGFGEAIGADLRLGWPDEYVGHGRIEELESAFGLDAESIVCKIMDFVSLEAKKESSAF